MALFGKKKTAKKEVTSGVIVLKGIVDTHVIVRPIITEKAAILNDKNVYAFEIDPRAGKHDVSRAVKKLWNVAPTKVRIVRRLPRTYTRGFSGRVSALPGLKKAYVYLKKGDRIDLV